jgi:futalosine hydrolase
MLTSPYVLIAGAVPEEILKIMEQLEFPTIMKIGGRSIIAGNLTGIPVQILATGPGPVNTAQAITAAIENERPGLIIQTGCAGSFRASGLDIGDIGLATQEIDVQLGIEPESPDQPPDDLPFDLAHASGLPLKNRYPLDPILVEKAFSYLNTGFAQTGIRIQKGTFVTVSTITATDQRSEMLSRSFSPSMESMEGAAGAYLSLHYDIPFLEIRSASNFVGNRNRESWNLPLAFDRAAAAVIRVMEGLHHMDSFDFYDLKG